MAARAVIHAAGKNGGINMRTESDGRSGIASGLTQWTSDEGRHAGARTHNAQTDRETNTSLFAMTSYRKRAMRKWIWKLRWRCILASLKQLFRSSPS